MELDEHITMPRPTFSLTMLLVFFIMLTCTPSVNAEDRQHAKRYPYLNPLLAYTDFEELLPFKEKIEALIEDYRRRGMVTEVAVYFRSMGDGMWFGVNERQTYSLASLIKVPVMLSCYKKAEQDPSFLKKKKVFTHHPTNEQNIISRNRLQQGQSYTLEQLIYEMIVTSDNEVFETVIEELPDSDLRASFGALGIQLNDEETPGDYRISLKAYVSIFRILYNSAYLNKAFSNRALKYLTESVYTDGLVAGVPQGVLIAHKFGERYNLDTGIRQLHDVGIVYHKRLPYLVGIMTKGSNFKELQEVVREISRMIYMEVEQQLSNPKAPEEFYQ